MKYFNFKDFLSFFLSSSSHFIYYIICCPGVYVACIRHLYNSRSSFWIFISIHQYITNSHMNLMKITYPTHISIYFDFSFPFFSSFPFMCFHRIEFYFLLIFCVIFFSPFCVEVFHSNITSKIIIVSSLSFSNDFKLRIPYRIHLQIKLRRRNRTEKRKKYKNTK